MLDEVVSELKKYNIYNPEIFKPSYKREITKFLIENSFRFELLILFGGDGTFNEAINGLMKCNLKPNVLYVPTGTVNDLGKYLSLSKRYKEAFKMLEGQTVAIDICKVNDCYFSYVLACGKFTNVSYGSNLSKYKRIFGRLYYYLRGVKDFFKKSRIYLSLDNNKHKKYFLVLILNIWRVGNFRIRCKKENKLNDGYVNVVLFRNTIFFGLFSLFMFLCFGVVIKGMVEVYKLSSFTISTLDKHLYNTDGEESYKTNNIKVEVVKAGLNLYVGKKGVSKYFNIKN